MIYETLIVDQTAALATITLNRPEARNALDFTMRRELSSALDEIEANPAARVVVLTGAGGHFCAGGDVKTMRRRHTAAEGRARVELLNRAVLRFASPPTARNSASSSARSASRWMAAAPGSCRAWSAWRAPRS